MPVIVLVGDAEKYETDLAAYFKDKYEIVSLKESFLSIRSSLSNQDPGKLYLVSNLDKPVRYEIFVLTRKNEQQFMTLSTTNKEHLASSDKNQFILEEFDGKKVEEELEKCWLRKTSANKRSKGVSLKGLSDVKSLINKINLDYVSKYEKVDFILNECEERMLKLCSFQTNIKSEELEECYKKIVEDELKSKGIM